MPKPSMEEIIKIVNEQNNIQNNEVIEEDEIEQAIKSILNNPITNFSDEEINELLEENQDEEENQNEENIDVEMEEDFLLNEAVDEMLNLTEKNKKIEEIKSLKEEMKERITKYENLINDCQQLLTILEKKEITIEMNYKEEIEQKKLLKKIVNH